MDRPHDVLAFGRFQTVGQDIAQIASGFHGKPSIAQSVGRRATVRSPLHYRSRDERSPLSLVATGQGAYVDVSAPDLRPP